MKKPMTIAIVLLTLVFGGIVTFNTIKSYMTKKFFANLAAPAVTVSSVSVKEQDWESRINVVGNLLAINGVDVNAQASGNVVAIHFDSGQYVAANTPLIDIDDSLEQATLKANQSELVLQDLNYKRQIDLAKHGATSSSSVDEARAKLLQAQAAVEKVQSQIQQKHIRAPFAGQLGIRQVNLGQYITPGQTKIVTLQSLDPLYLEFYLPEHLYKKIRLNQKINFSLEQHPNVLFEGTITAINSKIDTKTHNIQVQATLPNCPRNTLKNPLHSDLITVKRQSYDGKVILSCNSQLNQQHRVNQFLFVPGMFADIDILQPTKHKRLVIPTVAITYSLYGNSVYRIETDGKGQQTVKQIFVTIGDQRGNYTVIKKGLHAGQQIVTAGELKLQNGTPVTINNTIKLLDSIPEQLGE